LVSFITFITFITGFPRLSFVSLVALIAGFSRLSFVSLAAFFSRRSLVSFIARFSRLSFVSLVAYVAYGPGEAVYDDVVPVEIGVAARLLAAALFHVRSFESEDGVNCPPFIIS
jgi:hypothetical protein